MLKRLRAKWHGVPYELKDFWPVFYHVMKNNKYDKYDITTTGLYHAAIGESVPILRDHRRVYFYKVLGVYEVCGEDHSYSPKHFHLKYSDSAKL